MYLDPKWPLDYPNIHVIDGSEGTDNPDLDKEAAEAKYESIYEGGKLTVILTNNARN